MRFASSGVTLCLFVGHQLFIPGPALQTLSACLTRHDSRGMHAACITAYARDVRLAIGCRSTTSEPVLQHKIRATKPCCGFRSPKSNRRGAARIAKRKLQGYKQRDAVAPERLPVKMRKLNELTKPPSCLPSSFVGARKVPELKQGSCGLKSRTKAVTSETLRSKRTSKFEAF